LKEYPASLEEFQKVLLRYPRSRKVPDALFKRALTYNRMKNPRSAALEFEKLIEKYPRHPLSQKASGRLRGMRK
ncbi:MAG: tetratricopeptide repeat protein, partial [bacterium]